jgi:hypothetical protein
MLLAFDLAKIEESKPWSPKSGLGPDRWLNAPIPGKSLLADMVRLQKAT